MGIRNIETLHSEVVAKQGFDSEVTDPDTWIHLSDDIDRSAKVGDIVVDKDNVDWIVVSITHAGISHIKRNSLAHKVYAERSPEFARTFTGLEPIQ